MTIAAHPSNRAPRESIPSERGGSALPELHWHGLCAVALQPDCGAEAACDPGGDRGTSPPLPAVSDRGGASLQYRIPESLTERWFSYCGIKTAQVVQDYFLWEVLLNEHPQIRGIVELGTWEGGFSFYLAEQAKHRGLRFRTYDVAAPSREVPGFVQLDIFAEAHRIGRELRAWEPVILLCDNGNKPRELATFSRWLSPQSLIVVHDWDTEMLAADVPENVEMVYGEFCEEIESMSRIFRVLA